MEVVASLSQGRTDAAQYGLFTHKSVPVIFEPPCIMFVYLYFCRYVRVLQSQVPPSYSLKDNIKTCPSMKILTCAKFSCMIPYRGTCYRIRIEFSA